MAVKPEDVKHDPNPDADESELDFGDSLDGQDPDEEEAEEEEEAEGGEGDDAEAARKAEKAAKGKKADNGRGPGKAGGKAAAQGAEEDAEDGEGEGDDDEDAGAGDGDGAEGEDGEEALRAAGAKARREQEGAPRAGWVPPHRLREATQAARNAETRVRELEAQLTALSGGKNKADPVVEIEGQLDGLYEQVEEARAEGRVADAAKLQRQIDSLNRDITETKAARVATERSLETAQRAAYDATVEEIETKFPELNPDNEKLYDPELAAEVSDLAKGFRMAKGMTPRQAVLKALSYVFREEVLDTGTAHLYAAKKALAEKGEAENEKKGKGKEKAGERKSEQVKANIKASGRQPAPLGEGGKTKADGDKINMAALSEEEFDALPESTKARLRGDFIGA